MGSKAKSLPFDAIASKSEEFCNCLGVRGGHLNIPLFICYTYLLFFFGYLSVIDRFFSKMSEKSKVLSVKMAECFSFGGA